MPQRVYAIAADYYEFAGEEAATNVDKDLNAKLRRASTVIDGLTRTSRYDVDEEGYPTDANTSAAFKDATCAQAAWWDDTDDVTGAESQSGPTRIGSVSFGGSGASGGATNTKSAASSRIAPEAVEILTNAGLLSSNVDY